MAADAVDAVVDQLGDKKAKSRTKKLPLRGAVGVEALSELPEEATLDIVGRGEERYERSLHELAASRGLNARVRFDVVERQTLLASNCPEALTDACSGRRHLSAPSPDCSCHQ